MADVAAHVHLRRRLGEREERRTHADLRVGSEHLAGEEQDGLLEVRESDILIYIEAFHLMEDAVGARGNRFVAEHASGADHADREGIFLHRTHLHGGCVGAEKQRVEVPCGDEESVLHVAGGVVRREVEGLEHMVVVLDFGAFRHVVSELAEDIHYLLAHYAHWMAAAELELLARQGCIFFGAFNFARRLCTLAQLLDGGEGGLLEFVQRTSEGALLVTVDTAELLEERRDFTFLSKEAHARFFHFFLCLALESVQLAKHLFYSFNCHSLFPSFPFRCPDVPGLLRTGRAALEIFLPLGVVQYLAERIVGGILPLVRNHLVQLGVLHAVFGKGLGFLGHSRVVVNEDGIDVEGLPYLQVQSFLVVKHQLLYPLAHLLLFLLGSKRLLLGPGGQRHQHADKNDKYVLSFHNLQK